MAGCGVESASQSLLESECAGFVPARPYRSRVAKLSVLALRRQLEVGDAPLRVGWGRGPAASRSKRRPFGLLSMTLGSRTLTESMTIPCQKSELWYHEDKEPTKPKGERHFGRKNWSAKFSPLESPQAIDKSRFGRSNPRKTKE